MEQDPKDLFNSIISGQFESEERRLQTDHLWHTHNLDEDYPELSPFGAVGHIALETHVALEQADEGTVLSSTLNGEDGDGASMALQKDYEKATEYYRIFQMIYVSVEAQSMSAHDQDISFDYQQAVTKAIYDARQAVRENDYLDDDQWAERHKYISDLSDAYRSDGIQGHVRWTSEPDID